MDRTAWIAVTLCVIGLVGWEVYITQHAPPRPPATVTALPTASPASPVSPTPSAAADTTATPAAPSTTPAAAQPSPTVAQFAEAKESLRNSDFELRITNRGGGIAEADLFKHKGENGSDIVLNAGNHPPIGAMLEDPASPVLPEYKIARQGDAVVCEYVTPEGVTIRKRYSLGETAEKQDNYIAALTVEVQNTTDKPYANNGYYLALGAAQPIHQRDYPSLTRVVWSIDGRANGIDATWFAESGGILGLNPRPARPTYQETLKPAEWGAVSNQFFATIVTPVTGKADGIWGRRFEVSAEQKTYGIEGAVHMPALSVAPGQTATSTFQIWAGPKIYHRLARLDHNEAEIMNFGMFKLISQFLLNFMNWLHSIVKDYGVSILLLTAIIKGVLWPIQNKANRSMRQTAALAPKMQELREKYKDDPTKMNQEVMKLYKQYGINPVGGCLPMFIQIPIFFGLFTMLGGAVELRNASFLWIHDLSQPDTVGHILGYPINVMPLLMGATNVWLMQMTPKTSDPTQRRVAMFMPIIFLVFCYNFAAALALYYTTQNLFSILQFYQNKKQPMPALEKVAPAGKKGKK